MAPMNQLNTATSSRTTMRSNFRPSPKARANAFGLKTPEKSAPTTFGEDFLSEHSAAGLQAAAIRSANGAAKNAPSPQSYGFPS